MSNAAYFCPECGWEGNEPICTVCGVKAEALDVDPTTGSVADNETTPLDEIEGLGDFEEDEEDIA